MPIREFVDAAGVQWKVWSTVPYTTGVVRHMQAGWLTFESTESRRRLVPIPENWEDASLDRLRGYCEQATSIRHTPISGTPQIEETES